MGSASRPTYREIEMKQSFKKIAASLTSTSVAGAKRALKESGLRQTLADDLLRTKAEIDRARDEKLKAKAARHRRPTGRIPVRLPAGTPAQRLESMRIRAVTSAFVRAFRQPTHGDLSVVLTENPADVGIKQVQRDDWNIYAKRYTHGPAKCLDNTLTVPASWRCRVQRLGLDVVDGMMTLDASPVEGAPEGVAMFAATWASQGRGNAVNVSRGYIACSESQAYHADSPQRALAGLKRKLSASRWAAELQSADLDKIVGQSGDAIVKISDARAIGACEYGIKAWCNRVGIDYEAGETTVARVYEAYQAVPAPEARGAILHAIRRSRRHLALAA